MGLKVEISSAGIKSIYGGKGPLPVADLYIDCRGIYNPCYDHTGTGDDPAIQAVVKEKTNISAYTDILNEAISRLPIRRAGKDPYHKPFEVLCFCAHGIHRSRAMKHILAEYLKKVGVEVEVK